MSTLRLIAFDGGGALCLYLRLGGVSRVLVDCGCAAPAAPLAHLRRLGEVGPLKPLSRHLRPASWGENSDYWLGVLGLVRGLALRPGGSWVFWHSLPRQGPGFSLQARVLPRREVPGVPQLDFFEPPLLVLGLPGRRLAGLGGGPARWVEDSALTCGLPQLPGQGGDILVAGGRPGPPGRALAEGPGRDPGLGGLLAGAAVYAEGGARSRIAPAGPGALLERGLVLGLLPWLILGGLCPGAGGGLLAGAPGGRGVLRTPAVGSLCIDADDNGALLVQARPRGANRLSWRGVAVGGRGGKGGESLSRRSA